MKAEKPMEKGYSQLKMALPTSLRTRAPESARRPPQRATQQVLMELHRTQHLIQGTTKRTWEAQATLTNDRPNQHSPSQRRLAQCNPR